MYGCIMGRSKTTFTQKKQQQGWIISMPKKFDLPNWGENGGKRGKTWKNGEKQEGGGMGGNCMGWGGGMGKRVVIMVERSHELALRPCPSPLFAPKGLKGSWVGVLALDKW